MPTELEQHGQRDYDRTGGIRIETELLVRVIGRDGEAVNRQGDICASGFFFETEEWPGRAGDITVMEVGSEDGVHNFTTLATLQTITETDLTTENWVL